jgi:GNAT superfamily N-acetyltransferase
MGEKALREIADHFSTDYSTPPVHLVAEVDGHIVGTAGYQPSWMAWDLYELSWVMVDPSVQRRGIGRLLIDAIRQRVKENANIHAIIFTTGVPDFYVKLGCEVVRRLADIEDEPRFLIMDWL